MIKQAPPYYKNRTDNMSCALACYRSALKALTGKVYTWEELEELSGFQPGKAAWTVKVWTELAKQGFTIRMIEGFDYRRYFDEGESYLQTFLPPTELAWQVSNSNLLDIRPLIPEFLSNVQYLQRSPQLKDIDDMLAEGYLATVQLNSKVLNDKPGYTAHMILVYDKEGDHYIAHDPGLGGAAAGRRIAAGKMLEAMGGSDNTVEVTGIQK